MAINPRVLAFTLATTSAVALGGEHGDLFSTCGTSAQAQSKLLPGAGILPADALEYHLTDDQIEALRVEQREMLLHFERMAYEIGSAPHVCLHPDTDPKVAQAIEQFLNDLWFTTSPNAFILSTRWTRTATDGTGLNQGDPSTLTYSFVPDGTNISGEGASNLFSFMNAQVGAGTWEALYQTALDAWGDTSGLTYVREMNDDGATITGAANNNGILGIRGDVRISGNFIDGNSGVLAYNFFPNSGEIVMDTGDVGFFGNASNNYIRLRNVITHEAGHGIGLAHIESDSDRFLMEPFIDISFVGPQIDDIRGAPRGYGDMDENNNSFGNASDLNQIFFGNATPIMGGQFPGATLRSMDDNADIDYYSFVTGEPVTITAFVSPSGGSYQSTPQGGGGGGAFVNYNAISDLRFSVFDSSQSLVVAVDNAPIGQGESEIIELPATGQYFFVVDNTNVNNIQTYSIGMVVNTLTLPDCEADLNGDGEVDFVDISFFVNNLVDMNGDTNFDFVDISLFVTAFGKGCP